MTTRTAEKPKPQPVITSGAALCRALRESGTGADKLNIIRAALEKNPNLTAEDAFDLLYNDRQNVMQRTLDKARGLIDTGKVPEADRYTARVNIEDVIMSDRAANERAGFGTTSGGPGLNAPPPPPVPAVSEEIIRAKVRAEVEAEMKAKADADAQAQAQAQAEKAKADADKAKQHGHQNAGTKPK